MFTQVLTNDFKNVINGVKKLKDFDDKSVLITGATGLIGSLLAKFFIYLNENCGFSVKIYAVVRNEEKAKRVFLDYFNRPYIKLVVCDLQTQPLHVGEKVDYVVHTASVTASKEMAENPQRVYDVAINGTTKALNLAVECKSQAFVYLSSMEAYGTMPTDEKATEDMLGFIDESNPRSAYPLSKRECENVCIKYFNDYGLKTVCARLAQTFGAGVDINDNRVFNQFAKSVMSNSDIVLHTDGSSHGNYVYTADCIKAICILLLNGQGGQIYNVVNEECHSTILQMAKMVSEKVAGGNIKVKIELGDQAKLGYAPKTVLNLSSKKLRSLGWCATTPLEECYKRLLTHYKEMGV